jgi:ribosomal-protein-alanine N-acetyltransferase
MTPAPILQEVGADAADAVMQVMADAFDPAFGEAWTKAQCLGILGLPGVWLTLSRVEEEPVGFALGRIILEDAELLLLGVRPAWRRRGIGSALLARTARIARLQGASRLHLEVRDGNEAMALYCDSGFVRVGRRPGYYRGSDGQMFDALSLSLSFDAYD